MRTVYCVSDVFIECELVEMSRVRVHRYSNLLNDFERILSLLDFQEYPDQFCHVLQYKITKSRAESIKFIPGNNHFNSDFNICVPFEMC